MGTYDQEVKEELKMTKEEGGYEEEFKEEMDDETVKEEVKCPAVDVVMGKPKPSTSGEDSREGRKRAVKRKRGGNEDTALDDDTKRRRERDGAREMPRTSGKVHS